jgi:hypothetical protein
VKGSGEQGEGSRVAGGQKGNVVSYGRTEVASGSGVVKWEVRSEKAKK